jgi:1-acyl-sn-glycerol-3-phosphate acyltransferase
VQYQLSRIVAGPFLHTIWRPKVTGVEHVPATGGAILASNHNSVVDSVFLPLMINRPVTFSAKSEYFTASGPAARLWAAYLKATNQLRMDRDGPRAAQDTLEAALALLRQGNLFGIYPEGTRSPDGRLYRGRPGVGWLALKSGLPVIPVALSGTRHVLPPGRVVPRPGRIEVKVGAPLDFGPEVTSQAPAKARRLIADQVMTAIRGLSGQEYVDMFASDRKAELQAARSRGLPAPGHGPPVPGGYAHRGHRPNSSTVWSTSVKPASAATRSAHCSTARPSTSTLLPQLRQVRWWWCTVVPHCRYSVSPLASRIASTLPCSLSACRCR